MDRPEVAVEDALERFRVVERRLDEIGIAHCSSVPQHVHYEVLDRWTASSSLARRGSRSFAVPTIARVIPSHDALVAELAELIAIPSVSADAGHADDVRRAALRVRITRNLDQQRGPVAPQQGRRASQHRQLVALDIDLHEPDGPLVPAEQRIEPRRLHIV